jgi:hypothetical protein
LGDHDFIFAHPTNGGGDIGSGSRDHEGDDVFPINSMALSTLLTVTLGVEDALDRPSIWAFI